MQIGRQKPRYFGLTPVKYCRAVRRKMMRRTRRKNLGYPIEWKDSDRPLRYLWNQYYINTSRDLYLHCMSCRDWKTVVPSYRIAKTWIDRVVEERPTKIGNRADIWRDEMKQHLESIRWREINKRINYSNRQSKNISQTIKL